MSDEQDATTKPILEIKQGAGADAITTTVTNVSAPEPLSWTALADEDPPAKHHPCVATALIGGVRCYGLGVFGPRFKFHEYRGDTEFCAHVTHYIVLPDAPE